MEGDNGANNGKAKLNFLYLFPWRVYGNSVFYSCNILLKFPFIGTQQRQNEFFCG